MRLLAVAIIFGNLAERIEWLLVHPFDELAFEIDGFATTGLFAEPGNRKTDEDEDHCGHDEGFHFAPPWLRTFAVACSNSMRASASAPKRARRSARRPRCDEVEIWVARAS